jgi:glycosyltransferase involved in cell wall biosynthesis
VIRWSDPRRDVDLPAPLHEHAVAREPIEAGASTAMLERIVLPNGRRLVVKHVVRELDWMMQATNDTGRAAELWVSGVMDRLPPVIDPALVRIEDGWWLYMEEVQFHPRGTRFSRADVRRILDALAALHGAFWEEQIPGLCTLTELMSLLTPTTLAGFDVQFLDLVQSGWEVFPDVVPADVADAVFALLDDPAPLVRELEKQGSTLVHADPHFGNAVLLPDRLVLIDWTLATQAPPSVDFVWFLDQSHELLDATHDEVVDEYVRAEAGRVRREHLDWACVSQLLSSGWQVRQWLDSDDRPQREENLNWFVSRAQAALAS